MTESGEPFDPYYHWLGIPPDEQPPTHYRLLGIQALESNRQVIQNAADRQMAHLRTFASGKHRRAFPTLAERGRCGPRVFAVGREEGGVRRRAAGPGSCSAGCGAATVGTRHGRRHRVVGSQRVGCGAAAGRRGLGTQPADGAAGERCASCWFWRRSCSWPWRWRPPPSCTTSSNRPT